MRQRFTCWAIHIYSEKFPDPFTLNAESCRACLLVFFFASLSLPMQFRMRKTLPNLGIIILQGVGAEKEGGLKSEFRVANQLGSEKAMAPHSSTPAWKIPWTEETVRLQSMGSLRVGHDWETSLSLFTFMHWRRKWQPTPVFLPGESQGGSLVGCSLWGHTESETTEVT